MSKDAPGDPGNSHNSNSKKDDPPDGGQPAAPDPVPPTNHEPASSDKHEAQAAKEHAYGVLRLTSTERPASAEELAALAGTSNSARRAKLALDAIVTQLTLPAVVQSPSGVRVEFQSVAVHTDDGGAVWLDIRLGSAVGGDPHFRIFNPPLTVSGGSGRQYDPLGAVAELIAGNGGAATRGRK